MNRLDSRARPGGSGDEAKHASRKQGKDEGIRRGEKSKGYLVASQAWMKRSLTGQDRAERVKDRDSRPRKDAE